MCYNVLCPFEMSGRGAGPHIFTTPYTIVQVFKKGRAKAVLHKKNLSQKCFSGLGRVFKKGREKAVLHQKKKSITEVLEWFGPSDLGVLLRLRKAWQQPSVS